MIHQVKPDGCPAWSQCDSPEKQFFAEQNPLIFSNAIECSGFPNQQTVFCGYEVVLIDALNFRASPKDASFVCVTPVTSMRLVIFACVGLCTFLIILCFFIRYLRIRRARSLDQTGPISFAINDSDTDAAREKQKMIDDINKQYGTSDEESRRQHVDTALFGDSSAYSEAVCKICYSSPVDCVLLDCGHQGVCHKCAIRLDTCPFCTLAIKKAVRTYKM
eukprot:TRINITY_DN2909_c0_g2_i1.p1 TRINITY_DN2909_c0_g2~~TRINITY_DN2909_c0_g2_i1.p1  ORF type:complete len:219 (+),score=21.28 TRINITY_DN2909_c0_g2_i1:90-746(+)